MPIYPMLNKANDPEYWLLIGRESGQVSHEYWWEHISYAYLSNVKSYDYWWAEYFIISKPRPLTWM